MKIRELRRKSGEAVGSVWPPQWGRFYQSGDTLPHGEVGVLQSVERLGDRLTLRITYESAPGKESEASGGLQWDQPQSVDDVQKVLRVHVGQPIRAIGDLDV